MHKHKIFIIFLLAVCTPGLAEENLAYLRHFEVAAPKTSAPKPVPIQIPEPIELRRIPIQSLLLPIEADPATDISPDPIN